jgi:REP element-mobilizing transposase RayT
MMQSPGGAARMSHSYHQIYVHAVYATKGRKDLIPQEFEKRLFSFVASVAKNHRVPLLAIGGMSNHNHVLFALPPAMDVPEVIRTLKSNSSRFMNERGFEFGWQQGYGAFSVSASQLGTVKNYIRSQREHHKKRSFEEEFVLLLKKAGVPYDPKFVFG